MALDIVGLAVRLICGMDVVDGVGMAELERGLQMSRINASARGLLADLDLVAKAIVEQDAERP